MQVKLDIFGVHGILPPSNNALTSSNLKAVIKTFKYFTISVYFPRLWSYIYSKATFLCDLTDVMKSATHE